MQKLQLARSAFQQINHHRGLALTVKLANEFKKLASARPKRIVTHSQSLEPDRTSGSMQTAPRAEPANVPFSSEDSATLEGLY